MLELRDIARKHGYFFKKKKKIIMLNAQNWLKQSFSSLLVKDKRVPGTRHCESRAKASSNSNIRIQCATITIICN
jgi:hypothetical protein